MVVFGCGRKSPSASRVMTKEVSRLAGLVDMVMNFPSSECACEGVGAWGGDAVWHCCCVERQICEGHCFDLHPKDGSVEDRGDFRSGAHETLSACPARHKAP
jgi:hypothetical protein